MHLDDEDDDVDDDKHKKKNDTKLKLIETIAHVGQKCVCSQTGIE